jgi:hypothetical protein
VTWWCSRLAWVPRGSCMNLDTYCRAITTSQRGMPLGNHTCVSGNATLVIIRTHALGLTVSSRTMHNLKQGASISCSVPTFLFDAWWTTLDCRGIDFLFGALVLCEPLSYCNHQRCRKAVDTYLIIIVSLMRNRIRSFLQLPPELSLD